MASKTSPKTKQTSLSSLRTAPSVFRSILQLLSRSLILRVALIVLLLFIASAIAVFYVERDSGGSIDSLGEAFWWLIVTVATVGYGDFTPVTLSGRIIASILIILCVGLIPFITAQLASHVVTRHLREERGLEKIKAKNHTLLCGWNEHIDSILNSILAKQENPEIVLVNSLLADKMNELILRYKPIKLRFVHGDFTSEAILELANVRQAASVIVLSDTVQGDISTADERVVLATLAIKTMNPQARVCVEVANAKTAPHARRAGASEVIVHGEHDPYLLASAAVAEGVVLAARQLLSLDEENTLQQRAIPAEFVGRKFGELSAYFSEKQKAILIGLYSLGKSLKVEDVLGGDYSLIDEFIKRKFKEAGKEHLSSQLKIPQANLNPGDEYVIQPDDVALLISK
jgi:voltage-gated potassium channel